MDIPPDMTCSSWLDGVPAWLGGNGDEWLHCCIAHDLGASDEFLQTCVEAAGYPSMAFVMFVGVVVLNPLWRLYRRIQIRLSKPHN